MQKTLLLIMLLQAGLFAFTQTQNVTINLSLFNEQKVALENVTIELLRSKDSAFVKQL